MLISSPTTLVVSETATLLLRSEVRLRLRIIRFKTAVYHSIRCYRWEATLPLFPYPTFVGRVVGLTLGTSRISCMSTYLLIGTLAVGETSLYETWRLASLECDVLAGLEDENGADRWDATSTTATDRTESDRGNRTA